MKRVEQLQDLSRDHHQGLIIARKASRAAAAGELSVAKAWALVERRFPAELEPHFGLEEEYLLPVVEAVGMGDWADRVRAEHGRLRELAEGGERTPERLAEFGALLERHIRFEERELFETLQGRTDPSVFDRLAAACERHPRTCSLDE